MLIVNLVTTYNRPQALARSLPQIAALGWPTLVIDDNSGAYNAIAAICADAHVERLRLPQNRGLAAAFNIGLSYWLADARVDWINVLQDDVDLHPQFKQRMEMLTGHAYRHPAPMFITGHDANEHEAIGLGPMEGTVVKRSCRATHMLAPRDFWHSVLPIPTRRLGAPCPDPGKPRGLGSNVDWWITRDALQSVTNRGGMVVCTVPAVVRTFFHRAEDSCWQNEARGGADKEFVL